MAIASTTSTERIARAYHDLATAAVVGGTSVLANSLRLRRFGRTLEARHE